MIPETLYYPEMTEAAGVVSPKLRHPWFGGADVQDYWSVNTTEHRLFDQNMEAAMLYVRFCRQNLIPTPSPSPVPEPTADLLAAYDKYPNLDAKQPFDPKALRSHLDEVILVFGEHMTDEIETLSKDKISLVGEKEYAAIDGRLKAKLQAYGPEWFLCIAFGQYSTSRWGHWARWLTRYSVCADECFGSASPITVRGQKCARPGESQVTPTHLMNDCAECVRFGGDRNTLLGGSTARTLRI